MRVRLRRYRVARKDEPLLDEHGEELLMDLDHGDRIVVLSNQLSQEAQDSALIEAGMRSCLRQLRRKGAIMGFVRPVIRPRGHLAT